MTFIELNYEAGIRGYQLSNPPVWENITLLGSLNVGR